MLFTSNYLLKTYKLKNLVRYNHKTKITNENVAEHSYFVALFTLRICDKLKVDDFTKMLCLTKAILHDTPETELNDITYDVKRDNPKLNDILEELEDEFFKKYYNRYANLMRKDWPVTLVTKIVKLADLYSVVQFSLNEMMLGNKGHEMKKIHNEAKEEIEVLEKELMKYAEE